MLAVMTLMMLSPWDAPVLPAERTGSHVMQQCTEDDARSRANMANMANMANQSQLPAPIAPRHDEIRPPKIRRGVPPEALVALGATLFVAGTSMRLPAPVYMEIRPDTDPWREPAARAAYTTYTHSDPQIALGAVGTVFQAVGAGLLRRGIQGMRMR
jgi:hypothetical protein